MAQFSDMLAYLRKRSRMSQQELADRAGLSRSTIGMYESGEREPNFETAELFADLFNVSMDTLMGRESGATMLPPGILPMPAMVMVPRLGTIACGEPILAEQNIETYDEVPDYVKCDFTLLCKGDSMINARIQDGDIVCIKRRDRVENGQIAAVVVEGEYESEATLKRLYFEDGTITLQAENPAYAPKTFTGDDVNKVRVVGVATHFISTVK